MSYNEIQKLAKKKKKHLLELGSDHHHHHAWSWNCLLLWNTFFKISNIIRISRLISFEASRLVSKKSNGPQTYLRLLLYFPRQEGLDSDFMITMEIVDEVEQLRKPSGWGSFPFYASNSTATKTKSLLPITIRRDWNAHELVNAPGRNKFQVI